MDNENPQTPPTQSPGTPPATPPAAASTEPKAAPKVEPKGEPKKEPKRVFVYDGREFPDIDPKKSTEEIRGIMADHFPELSNADTSQSKRGDDTVIEFRKRTGTKGR